MYEIGVGVVAGLIATLLSLGVRSVWLRIVIPWYEERVYSDARIEGRWKARISYGGRPLQELWTLERQSHRVFGQIVALDGEDQGKTWAFEGIFKNLLLSGTYASTDRSLIDRGAFTFRLINNGNTLLGLASAYYDPSNSVRPVEYQLEREGQMAVSAPHGAYAGPPTETGRVHGAE